MSLFNVKEMAEKEVTKIVQDIEHLPGVKDAETNVKTGIATLEAFASKLTPDEIAAGLNIVFPGKFTAAEVTIAMSDTTKMLAGLNVLQSAVHQQMAGK